MRELIMSNMVSLDGYFEAGPGQLDWFAADAELEEHLRELHDEVGGYLYGRRTYQGMEAYWRHADHWIADYMNQVPKVVVSRSLESVDWNNSRIIRDVPGDVEKLKQESGKAVFVAGSADLVDSLIRHRLIDEYRLMVNPILLGGGNPLFKPMANSVSLKLLEARPLPSGGVILRYEPGGQASEQAATASEAVSGTA
jgi:dihydrofolate reductase